MATDYKALDRAIVKAIAQGKSTTHDLRLSIEPHTNALLPCLGPLVADVPLWRTIDRRLQALRKRGDIVFCRATRAWGITPQG